MGRDGETGRNRKTGRWVLLSAIVFGVILVPFALFGHQIEVWTEQFIESASQQSGWVALVLGLLLAVDILAPVPSSLVSTAAGLLLGFVKGAATSLAGMTISCAVGFWLAARFGRSMACRLVGEKELNRLERMSERFGSWVIVISRPVPVLAEASVMFAGLSGMPLHRFLLLSTLSNLGISAVYAAVGAFSATTSSFLLAFAGSILLPLLAMIATKPISRTGTDLAGPGSSTERRLVFSRLPILQVASVAASALLLVIGGVSLRFWLSTSVRWAATVGELTGPVEILSSDTDVWRAAVDGIELAAGDRIRVGQLAAATLTFFDGSAAELQAETELTIVQMSSRRDGGSRVIVLHQWLGQSHNRVQPLPDAASRFEIETRAAVATVRGTEFILGVQADGTTRVMVVEGTVDVMSEAVTVSVQAGHETIAQPRQPPTPAGPTAAPSPAVERTSAPRPEGAGPSESPTAVEPSELPQSTELPGLPESSESSDPADTQEPPEHPDHPEHPEHPDHPEKPEKPDKPKKTKKPKKE